LKLRDNKKGAKLYAGNNQAPDGGGAVAGIRNQNVVHAFVGKKLRAENGEMRQKRLQKAEGRPNAHLWGAVDQADMGVQKDA
jgi:hypothetical protein